MTSKIKKYLYLSIICLIATAILVAYPKGSVFAAATDDKTGSLVAPTAIAAYGDNLFIADCIEEDGDFYTVVHRLTTDEETDLFADKTVKGKPIALACDDKNLFVTLSDGIYVCDYTQPSPAATKAVTQNGIKCSALGGDYLFYVYPDAGDASVSHIAAYSPTDSQPKDTYPSTEENLLIAPTALAPNTVAMYYGDGFSKAACLSVGDSSVKFVSSPKPFTLTAGSKKVFLHNGTAYGYDSRNVFKFVNNTDDFNEFWTNGGVLIKDVAVGDDKMFLLADYEIKSVDGKQNAYYQKPRVFTVDVSDMTSVVFDQTKQYGASQLDFDIPAFTVNDVKIATVKGYPSNIIYTTKDKEKSIEKSRFAPTDKILVLAKDKGYVYVCFGNKYAWIKDSDKIIYDVIPAPTELGAITFVPTNLYKLPFADDSLLTGEQIPKLSKVTVVTEYGGYKLIKYAKESGDVYGFAQNACIGVNRQQKTYVSYTRYAANPKAGHAMTLFNTQLCQADDLVTDSAGNPVKIKSGQQVRLYEKTSDGKCFIGVLVNNTLYKGYLENDSQLKNYAKGLTNTQVLAIALFAILILVVVFLIVMRIRSKHHNKQSTPINFDFKPTPQEETPLQTDDADQTTPTDATDDKN